MKITHMRWPCCGVTKGAHRAQETKCWGDKCLERGKCENEEQVGGIGTWEEPT